MTQAIGGRHTRRVDPELRQVLEALDRRFEEQPVDVARQFAELRAHMDRTGQELHRHFGASNEAFRHDTRAIAEGVAGVNQRLEALEAGVRASQASTDQRLLRVEARVSTLARATPPRRHRRRQ